MIIKDEQDTEFKIWISSKGTKLVITGPDGKPVKYLEKVLFKGMGGIKGKHSIQFLEITIPKDGKKGLYRIGPTYTYYFGCSIRKVAIICGNKLTGSGDACYVKSDDLGAPEAYFLLTGSPGTSFDIQDLNGKSIFSETFVRPASDAVGVGFNIELPKNKVLKLIDRYGVLFPNLTKIPLYPYQDGVFELSPDKL